MWASSRARDCPQAAQPSTTASKPVLARRPTAHSCAYARFPRRPGPCAVRRVYPPAGPAAPLPRPDPRTADQRSLGSGVLRGVPDGRHSGDRTIANHRGRSQHAATGGGVPAHRSRAARVRRVRRRRHPRHWHRSAASASRARRAFGGPRRPGRVPLHRRPGHHRGANCRRPRADTAAAGRPRGAGCCAAHRDGVPTRVAGRTRSPRGQARNRRCARACRAGRRSRGVADGVPLTAALPGRRSARPGAADRGPREWSPLPPRSGLVCPEGGAGVRRPRVPTAATRHCVTTASGTTGSPRRVGR